MIINEQQTAEAQAKLAAQLKDTMEALKNNKTLIAVGVAGKKVAETVVKGIDQGTKAKRLLRFFGSTVVTSFKEAMEKKKEQDRVIENAINLFNQK